VKHGLLSTGSIQHAGQQHSMEKLRLWVWWCARICVRGHRRCPPL